MKVAALGRAAVEGVEAGGVVAVVKHMPGLGRASADSHDELPLVDASDEDLASDLAPFRALASAPAGMVAHLVLAAWDPDRPASASPTVIRDVIRGRIGFEGLLLSDDIAMGALSGPGAERAAAALEAGCDLALHCSGVLDEAVAVARRVGDAETPRLGQAMARRGQSELGSHELLAKRDALFAAAGLAHIGR